MIRGQDVFIKNNAPTTLNTLTPKHRHFVEAYEGDVITAMLAAGFKGAPNYLQEKGEELLANPLIVEAIKERSRYKAKTLKIIADREERQALLTSFMRNEDPHYKEETDSNGIPLPVPNIPLANRLKALELLGKSEGDFVENVNINGNVTLTDLVTKSYKVVESVDEIEAEYRELKELAKLNPPEPTEDSLEGKYL